VRFPVRRGWLRRADLLTAVDGVDLELAAGEAVGIVGESGSGKSTLARAVLQLLRPTAGQVVWMGSPVGQLPPRDLRNLRRDLQIVFQDPLGSLDPRMTVAEAVSEPLRVHRRDLDRHGRRVEAGAMLARVGLASELLNRYPHELSGGQCQRVAIARAMILRPRLLVCDEPVSALDVSVQAQVIGLLLQLKREWGVAILFILVLYLGRMMELAPVAALDAPLHPYTRALMAAVPVPDPDVQPHRLARVRDGEMPSAMHPPSGCVFRTRCPHAIERCAAEVPSWEMAESAHHVACHRWREF
jgi:oligopeptide transport system ATP-binding protein